MRKSFLHALQIEHYYPKFIKRKIKLTKLYTKNTNNPMIKWAKELGKHFTEDIEVMYKYMKKYTLY